MSALTDIVLILRFRDLSPRIAGYTIDEHRKCITKHGYTWWGWWAKQSEPINVQLWSDLAVQIHEHGPARAYLLDSGQQRLYETTIEGVEFETNRLPIPAPEKGEKTPPYYTQPLNDKELPAYPTWFKLGPITDAAETALHGLVWRAEPHDTLASPEKADLVNRVVAGIPELLQFGNITYWVTAPVGPDARPSRAELLHHRVLPPISPTGIIVAANRRILHISDLHVAAGKHAFVIGKGDAHNVSLAAALHQALMPDRLPGIVVVTGDLTWTGAAAEFDAAFAVLDELRSFFGLTREQFIVVPGNHDIQWSTDQTLKDAYEHQGKVEVASAEARANYAAFFARWYGTAANEWLSIGRRFFVPSGPTLDILGVNSSALQAVKDTFAGLGRVTEQALLASASELGWRDGRSDAQRRLLAVHHHVLPVYKVESPKELPKGFGLALDAGSQLHHAARFGVDLVLHGHQHHPFAGFAKTEQVAETLPTPGSGVLVLGAGSASVTDDHLGPIHQRSFNLLSLENSHVAADVYTASGGAGFTLHTTVTSPYGSPWQRISR